MLFDFYKGHSPPPPPALTRPRNKTKAQAKIGLSAKQT